MRNCLSKEQLLVTSICYDLTNSLLPQSFAGEAVYLGVQTH